MKKQGMIKTIKNLISLFLFALLFAGCGDGAHENAGDDLFAQDEDGDGSKNINDNADFTSIGKSACLISNGPKHVLLPFAGMTQIRFKGYVLSLSAPLFGRFYRQTSKELNATTKNLHKSGLCVKFR